MIANQVQFEYEMKPELSVAIMQPYFLPYLGYFQLIVASDVFVFYDDVNFIKKGWLRRNRIWARRQAHRGEVFMAASLLEIDVCTCKS